MQFAVLVPDTGSDRDDFALDRFLLCGVGYENAAGRLRFRLDTADQDAVLQWTQLHKGLLGPNVLDGRFGTLGSRVPTGIYLGGVGVREIQQKIERLTEFRNLPSLTRSL